LLLDLKNISKSFYTINRKPGIKGIFSDILFSNQYIIKALEDINFSISIEDRIGLIGKNGSGKSTLIKILSSVLKPTTGYIYFNNSEISKIKNHFKKQIGVFWGQRFQLSNELALQESFELLRFIYGIEKNKYRERIQFLLNTFKIEKYLKRPVRELSLGQRIICEISAIFIHSPKIIFLDEPTIGLDLEIKELFYNSLLDL